MAEAGMRIGTLARLAGISTSALRYYEQTGLLGPAERTEAGYRIYASGAVGRLQFVQRAKAFGLSLGEVRDLLASQDGDIEVERERLRHFVAHKLAETRRRVGEMQALEGELESLYVRLLRTTAPTCGHLGDCGCWLPTKEEVNLMAEEVACCGEQCCPRCACVRGEACDCSECPCCQD